MIERPLSADLRRSQRPGQVIGNLGSLNIDRVYHVAHIVRPGKTIADDEHVAHRERGWQGDSDASVLNASRLFRV